MRFETSVETKESIEKGKNVEILLRFIRHGERDKDGNLTDYGRDVTKRIAAESSEGSEFDAVKAIGSTAGPKGPGGLARSLETADIYAQELAGDEAFKTRPEEILSYETFIHDTPLDYTKIYNSHLPANFDEISSEKKAEAAKKAQAAVVNHLIGLSTPEAEDYKREAAGSFAYLIEHYRNVAERLKSGSKALIPAGTHGGVMEFILQQALVRTDAEGRETVGFNDLSEIGGEFSPSESYDIDIQTDEEGKQRPLVVKLAGRVDESMYLDEAKVQELAEFYKKLHGIGTK